jgi:hypothetical protein
VEAENWERVSGVIGRVLRLESEKYGRAHDESFGSAFSREASRFFARAALRLLL